MFVSNWLTWNSELKQANCSNPSSSSMSGFNCNVVILLLYFFYSIQHQWSLHSIRRLWNGEPGSISSTLETLQIPAGVQLSPVRLSTCHVTSNQPLAAREVQCRGKGFLPMALCGSAICSCQSACVAWKVTTLWHTHCMPSFCLRIYTMIMSHDMSGRWW